MNKILLIHPPCLEKRINDEDVSAPPSGLYYIGAVLKEKRYDVEILNWYAINQTPAQIPSILKAQNPAIIGFSVLQANRWGAIEIAAIAKRILPDVKIVFGGVSATFLWEHFLTHFPQIDYVVLGEGEYTFLKLVTHIRNNEPMLPEYINGLAFRKGTAIVKTAPAAFISEPKVRSHSAAWFVNQLALLYKKGIKFFYFGDDTFTLNKKRVMRICHKISEQGLDIRWAAISRVNFIDAELLAAMRLAGCIRISYGVESGSERIRKFLNKNITRTQIEIAFGLTTQYGIMARAYFIYGSPGENEATIQATLDLMDTIKPLSAIFYILDLFPGTALYEAYKHEHGVTDDIWLNKIEDIMYFETDANLSEKQILAFGKRLRTAFYKQLPAFVNHIRLTDDRSLLRHHAGFLSRLGMTFDHGDYAGVKASLCGICGNA